MPLAPSRYALPDTTARRLRTEQSTVNEALFYKLKRIDHLGLALYPLVPGAGGGENAKEHRRAYLDAVASRFNGLGSWCDVTEEFAARHLRLAASYGARAAVVEVTTRSRLIVGLGAKNLLEIGMTVHHAGGFPFVPATAAKGLARAWTENDAESDAETHRRVLGWADDDDSGLSGAVRFYGGIPLRFPRLEVDVMTPHYGSYYGGGAEGTAFPGDWESPVPVPFLTVAAGETFRYVLVANADNADDLAAAERWLRRALVDLGAGAKTSSGHGRFKDPAVESTDFDRFIAAFRFDHVDPPPPYDIDAVTDTATDEDWAPRRLVKYVTGLAGKKRPNGEAVTEEEASPTADRDKVNRLRESDLLLEDEREVEVRDFLLGQGRRVRAEVAAYSPGQKTARVYLAAEGHDRDRDVECLGVPEDADLDVGDWATVQITGYSVNKERVGSVSYLGPSEKGELAEPTKTESSGDAPGLAPTEEPSSAQQEAEALAEPDPSRWFTGTVKRFKRSGFDYVGQIDPDEDHPELPGRPKFDATAAGADDEWPGCRVRYRIVDGEAVDVSLL